MKTIVRPLLLLSALLTSVTTHAECTLKAAQTKMVETTNMMQVYNRQKITYIEEDSALPADFEDRYNAFVDRSNQLAVEFGEAADAKPNIGFEDLVSQSLCDGYEALFSEYAPAGYAKKAVTLPPTTAGVDCTTNGLWAKYGTLIQKQATLTKAGKFSNAENADMMRLSTKLGEAATTDLAAACVHLDEFERIINSK